MSILSERLVNAKLKDLVSDRQQIVFLEHNQKVGDAIKVLAKQHVLSAPLIIAPGLEDVESLGGASAGPSLIGWIDVHDIMSAFLRHLHDKKQKLPTSMLLLMSELDAEGPHFTEKMLITITSGEDRGLLYQTDAETSLATTLRDFFLSKRDSGQYIHRVAVFDAHGEITNIVSQMDIVRWLTSSPDILGDVGNKSVTELGLHTEGEKVVTVDPHLPTLIAFEQMLHQGVSGAAVVAQTGQMMANLSVSDLRCIHPEHLSVLALPVAEFLALSHNTEYLGFSRQTSESSEHPFFAQLASRPAEAPGADEDEIRLITCKRSSALIEVLKMMVDNRVHRVYIVDPDNKPCQVVGVITPSDVLTLLLAPHLAPKDAAAS